MNEKLNLIAILKDCPSGTKLYSPIYGEGEFVEVEVDDDDPQPIVVKVKSMLDEEDIIYFTSRGTWDYCFEGECLLFPSKDQRDWSKFKVEKPKFDPNTLQPFDKVLVKDKIIDKWKCSLFSHIVNGDYGCKYSCIGSLYAMCIPYNDDTKHLVGKTEEAPEYYRYWED